MVMETISQLPLLIEKSGNYRLENSLKCSQEVLSLEVSASNVTIDLNGYCLESESETAILVHGDGFSLRNGSVKAQGVAISTLPAHRAQGGKFKDLKIQGDVHLSGSHMTFENCQVEGRSYGLHLGPHALISDCQVTQAFLGIEVGPGSVLNRCRVTDCDEGVYAFGSREEPSQLSELTVSNCRGLGVRMDGPGTVERCQISGNGKETQEGGLLAGPASVVRDCVVIDNLGGDILTVDPVELSNNQTS